MTSVSFSPSPKLGPSLAKKGDVSIATTFPRLGPSIISDELPVKRVEQAVSTTLTSEDREHKKGSASLPSVVNVNALDARGRTRLYFAVKTQDQPKVESLLAEKASVYIGKSPLPHALKNVPILLCLLGISQIQDLKDCASSHHVFNVIFPPIKEMSKEQEQAFRKKIPKTHELALYNDRKKTLGGKSLSYEALLEEILKLMGEKLPDSTSQKERVEFLEKSCSGAGPEIIIKALCNDPHFASLFNAANSKHVLQVVPLSEGQKFDYDPKKHILRIGNAPHIKDSLKGVIYGMVLAIRRKTLQKIDDLGLDRETYTAVRSCCHYQDLLIYKKIFNPLFGKPSNYRSFRHFWVPLNKSTAQISTITLPLGISILLPEGIRREWEKQFPTYLAKNSDLLLRRFPELLKV